MKEMLLRMAEAVRRRVAEVPMGERSISAGLGALDNPTSRVDRAAEDAVIAIMDSEDVELNLLSEEAGFVDRGFRDSLILDPVDGTFNCYTGVPFFSTSLAIGRGSLSGVTEGLVMNLVTGDVFHAEGGKGATLNGSPIHVRKPGKDKLLFTYLGASATPRAHAAASRFRRVRGLGSVALELCHVAAGHGDAFLIDYIDERKSPRVVDIAAGLLILREAGGEAWDANLKILDMPLSLEVRRNMAAASEPDILELMA